MNFEVYKSKEVKKKKALTSEGKIMPTRNKLQKVNMHVMTSQYETGGKKNAHLLSQNVEPSRA